MKAAVCAIFLSLFGIIALAEEFRSPRLEAATSWIGNTFGGAKRWVQQEIHALAVMPDGTLFTNVGWDEAGGNVGEYRNGQLLRYAMHTHGWGNSGGEAVTANSRYVYFAMAVDSEEGGLKDPETWPPRGVRWLGVSRRLRSDLGKGAPFEGGKGGKGDSPQRSFLVVAETPEKAHDFLPGLCASETRLYVANPILHEILVLDAETMQPVDRWKGARTGSLALDRQEHLWILQGKTATDPARIARWNAIGEEQPGALNFAPEIEPLAFCLADDGRIFVADDGPAQCVRIYTPDGGEFRETGSFGEHGGIGSGVPGEFGDRKFNHVTALGLDAGGNIYVAQDGQTGGGGTILESYYLQSGSLNWRLFGLTFVDMGDIDEQSDSDIFSKEEHFHFNYDKAAGQEWSYAGYTVARLRYPEDPRLHLWSGGAWIRHIAGQRILFVNDMYADRLQVYRFAAKTDGEVAIPSCLFAKSHIRDKEGWPPNQPEKGEWLWRDQNGNGAFDAAEFTGNGGADAPVAQAWWVDRAGGIWMATEKAGIRYFPSQGLDERGNPQWNYETMQTFPHPKQFSEVKRLRYDSDSDTLYLGGTTEKDKNQHWKPMGPVVARHDGWLKGDRTRRWSITLPYSHGSAVHESCEPMGFDVAGDFLFASYTGASKPDGVSTGRIEIFRVADGSAAGHVEPGSEVGEVGLQDLRETITAHRRANGEYIVQVEDDAKSKILVYRISGLK